MRQQMRYSTVPEWICLFALLASANVANQIGAVTAAHLISDNICESGQVLSTRRFHRAHTVPSEANLLINSRSSVATWAIVFRVLVGELSVRSGTPRECSDLPEAVPPKAYVSCQHCSGSKLILITREIIGPAGLCFALDRVTARQ